MYDAQEQMMSADDVLNEIRESLNGRPGQPIVFGVCKALAERAGKEPWIFLTKRFRKPGCWICYSGLNKGKMKCQFTNVQ